MLAQHSILKTEEINTIAFAINDMADKAWDLNDIYERLLREPHTQKEIAELLIAFELTTEQLRGFSEDIDGKLYEIADRIKEGKKGNSQKQGRKKAKAKAGK